MEILETKKDKSEFKQTEFGKYLEKWLEPKGSGKQARLARGMGVTSGQVTKWKSGEQRVTLDYGVPLAQYLNMSPFKLFEMDDQLDLGDALRQLFPSHTKARVISEKDLYRDPAHARVHSKLQELLARSHQELAAIELVVDAFLGFPTTK